MNIKISIASVIFITASLLIAACYLLPQVQIFIRIQDLALLSAIYFFAFSYKKIGIISLQVIIWSIPFLLIYFFVSRNLDFKYGLLHPIMLLWVCIFPAFMNKTIEERDSNFEKYSVLIGVIVMAALVIANTITIMQIDPTIARTMTSGLADEDYVLQMKRMGVGGFGISYSSGLLTLSSLLVYLNASTKYLKIGGIISLLFFLYMVLNAQFTTLLIITIISVGLMLYMRQKSLWVILFVILIFFIPAILQKIIDFYGESSPVASHLSYLYNNITGEGIEEESQRDIYRREIIALIFQSPLWGYSVEGTYAHLFTHSHSTLLGYGLATGFVGVVFYITTIIKVFKYSISNYCQSPYNKFFLPMLVFYLLLSFFNPTNSPEINFAFFLIVPLIYSCLINSK